MYLLGFLDSGLSRHSTVKIQGAQVLALSFSFGLVSFHFRASLTFYMANMQRPS